MSDHAEWVRQSDARVRFEWGTNGVTATNADIVVVVDVLRFTTAVGAACEAGATVFPYRWRDGTAGDYAASVGAVLADGADPLGPSLSPVRLRSLSTGARIVLPSPNGSTCAVVGAERGATVVAASLRNTTAVAQWIGTQRLAKPDATVAVIACGERWPDGSLRPSLEDYLGAAALVSLLAGSRSPEAEVAALSFAAVGHSVRDLVRTCSSGRELVERGWEDDLEFAVDLDTSTTVPVLVDGAFVSAT